MAASIIGNLAPALGLGRYKVFAGTTAVTGAAAVVTGLKALLFAFAQPQVASATASVDMAYIHSIVGGTINVGSLTLDNTGPTITNPSVTAQTMALFAIGS